MNNKYYIDEPFEISGTRRIYRLGEKESLNEMLDKLNNHDRLVEENEKLKEALRNCQVHAECNDVYSGRFATMIENALGDNNE